MVTLGEAARRCGCGKSTITKAIAGGRLKATRGGNGSWQIEETDLEAYAAALEARRAKTATVEATGDATVEVTVELRVRAELAEARLADLKALYEDMVRQRDDMAGQRTQWETVAMRLTRAAPALLELPASSPVSATVDVTATEAVHWSRRAWRWMRKAS